MAEPRPYRLGRRQAAVDRTRGAILAAARDLVAAGWPPGLSVGAVASRAGVSRITVYNRFGSREGLLQALAAEAGRRAGPAPAEDEDADPRARLRQRIVSACSKWASDPALFRQLPDVGAIEQRAAEGDRGLVEQLAASDQLRPGCSIKEAEDVIALVTSFGSFERLHNAGRRTPASVAEILLRLAGGVLA
jgi:AcrR family transcriptional regulator